MQGFSDWSRRDFNQFVRMCGEYGRDDLDSICKEVEGKTEEEVWFQFYQSAMLSVTTPLSFSGAQVC